MSFALISSKAGKLGFSAVVALLAVLGGFTRQPITFLRDRRTRSGLRPDGSRLRWKYRDEQSLKFQKRSTKWQQRPEEKQNLKS